MISGTHHLVVLGLVGCLASLEAGGQDRDFTPSPCPSGTASGEPISLVGLTDDVDASHAPGPTNDSERLLFRQVYDTLVRIDCDSTVHPALAASWQLDAARTAWIVTLRRDAHFADGTTVRARDVIASWTRGSSTLSPDVMRFVRSATALDDLTLSVVMQRTGPQGSPAPDALAQPALAVARFEPGSPWPLGTRDARLEAPQLSGRGRSTIALVPSTLASAPDPTAPGSSAPRGSVGIVRFLVAPGGDARDLLDQGVDVLVTRDPAALAYANVLAQFDSLPLPWLRSYVFIARHRASGSTLTPELRQAFADDAVAGEAQGASLDWPEARDRCGPDTSIAGGIQASSPGTNAPERIAYDRSDPVAGSLAGRIVALTSARPSDGNRFLDALLPGARGRKLQPLPLRDTDLFAALTRADDTAFVIALDRSTGCAGIAMLLERAPWLTGSAVVPLVDTRQRALVRRGRAHMAIEWDGSLLLGGPVPPR